MKCVIVIVFLDIFLIFINAQGDLFLNSSINQNLLNDESDEHIDDYICVPYYECDPESDTIITNGTFDGAGVIDIRFGANKCDHYMDVKCKKPPNYDKTTKKPMQDIIVTTKTPVNFQCGVRNINGIDFKIKGNHNNESEFGEFPWMVAVLKTNKTYDGFFAQCGGSIIHPKVILTGAHCISGSKPEDIIIRAGEWDTQTTKERFPYQERKVSEIKIHYEYKSATLYNDIALLVLKSPLVFDKHISEICLPNSDQISNQQNCFATGWGKNNFGKQGSYQVILKKIQLPIIEQKQCQSNLRTTRLGQHFLLHYSFICAGGRPGQDTCTGDGGSPLVCPYKNESNRYYQTGIVAWGIGCGNNIPGVYVNVALFRNWIDRQMISIN